MDKKVNHSLRYRINDLILDSGTFQVSRNGELIELPQLSFQLLLLLARATPNVVSFDDLMEKVWPGRVINHETVTQRVKLLRQALGDDAADPQYIGHVRGVGYRMIADVELLPAIAEGPFSRAVDAPKRPSRIGHLMLLLVFLGGLFLVYSVSRPGLEELATQEGEKRSAQQAVAVLPFANASENPDDLYISEGLGDELRDQLGGVLGLRIAARSSSVAFREERLGAKEIAARLGVSTVIEGTFRREGDQLRISVQVIDGSTGFQSWARTYTLGSHDLLAVQQQIVGDVVQQLLPLADKGAVAYEAVTRSVSANELILLARHYEQQVRDQSTVDQSLLLNAIDLYRQATIADPESALAHSRLGGALLYLGDVEAAEGPIFESLKLDPDLSEVQYTLGLYYWKRELPGSGAAYERAIQLNANNADALTAYAMWRWNQAEANNSERYYQRALALDPMQPSRYAELASFYAVVGRMEEAFGVAQQMQERFSDEQIALVLASIYGLTGDLDLAIAWALRSLELQPDNPEPRWMLAELFVRIGEPQRAAEFEPEPGLAQLFWSRRYPELIDLAEELAFEQPSDVKIWYTLARAYSATGRFDQAVSILHRTGLPGVVYSDSRRGDAIEALVILADAYDALGEQEAVAEYTQWLVTFFEGEIENGFDKGWWPNIYLACTLAVAGRDDEAMARLNHIAEIPGLAWYPVLMDGHCFQRFSDDPRYLAVVENVQQRMAALRGQLPGTLAAFETARMSAQSTP